MHLLRNPICQLCTSYETRVVKLCANYETQSPPEAKTFSRLILKRLMLKRFLNCLPPAAKTRVLHVRRSERPPKRRDLWSDLECRRLSPARRHGCRAARARRLGSGQRLRRSSDSMIMLPGCSCVRSLHHGTRSWLSVVLRRSECGCSRSASDGVAIVGDADAVSPLRRR